LLVCALGFRFACGRVADRGRFASAYSSYGSGPKGARALFLLAQQLGARPRRWAEDLAALPSGSGMLVALGGCDSDMARPLSRYEKHELEHWVEQGGVLLVAGERHYIPKGFGIGFASEPGCAADVRFARHEREDSEIPPEALGPPDKSADGGVDAGADAGQEASPDAGGTTRGDVPVVAAPLRKRTLRSMLSGDEEPEEPTTWASALDDPLRGLEPLPLRRPGKLELEPDTPHSAVLGVPDESGESSSSLRELGVVVPRGRGRVIALASASMLQNRALGLSDGGLMFARLLRAYAPAGPVMFDEYHLGVGERRSLVRYLREAGATPFALQLLCAALLFLWRGGARFGGLRVDQAPVPPGSVSLVAAMGNLFARTKDTAGASQILIKQALSRVAAYHRVPPAPAQTLAKSLEDKGLHDAASAVAKIALAERAVTGEGGLATKSRYLDLAVQQALGPLAPRAARKPR
ncbi:MAG: DUF4350 domain-containing protein, partial [Polyangiales bacterium]